MKWENSMKTNRNSYSKSPCNNTLFSIYLLFCNEEYMSAPPNLANFHPRNFPFVVVELRELILAPTVIPCSRFD